MKRLNDLDYLKLNKLQAFWYKLRLFFCAIPAWLKRAILKVLGLFKGLGLAVKNEFVDIGSTFKQGNWAVKLSFLVFGFGNLYYGQIARGILFLAFEAIFIGYMLVPSGGLYWLAKGNWFKLGSTIGTVQGHFEYNEIYDTDTWVPGDDSVKVLLSSAANTDL